MMHKYKKYIVFEQPSIRQLVYHGGMYDITGSFDLLEEALDSIGNVKNAQIVDRDTWEIVHSE